MSIDAKLQKQTGLIHSGGAGRRYSITTNKYEIVASLVRKHSVKSVLFS